MKFRVLGCSGGQIPGHNLSSYLLNDSLLIDVGSATAVLEVEALKKVKNILITHAHLDHVMGLATIADNLFGHRLASINVWGLDEVIAELKSSFFNDVIWPDFTQLTAETQPWPVLTFHSLREEEPMPIGDCTVTMVRVNHIVPSVAFFIENNKKILLHVGDTGPTEKVWVLARRRKNLCAVVLESSFPNRLQDTADRSRHLTPRSLSQEAEKLRRPSVPILATHLKPQYRKEIIMDLKQVKGRRIRVLKDGDSIVF